MSRRRANLQLVEFDEFCKDQENKRNGISHKQHKQCRHMMLINLLKKVGNIISLLIGSTVSRHSAHHVELWWLGPNLTNQNHLPKFLISWEWYIQIKTLVLRMSVLTRLVRLFEQL